MSKTLSSAAADALRAATADATSVTLAPGQLDRKVYVEVNTTLERIAGGGKWNRKAKAHLFKQDPRPALAELVGADQITMPADQVKLMSFWRTPPMVVARMLELAGDSLVDVLEPSAGDGAIADAVREHMPDFTVCVEPDDGRAAMLRDKGHIVDQCTFEQYAAKTLPTALRFTAVVMNPPFTVPGNASVWVDHVGLALDLLAPMGRLVAVLPVSYIESTHKNIVALRERCEGLGGTWEPLADGAFKESGTGVRTGVLAVSAPGMAS